MSWWGSRFDDVRRANKEGETRMTHVFEVQVGSQGRIVIPSYVRLAADIKLGDWIVVQVGGRVKEKEKAKA